MDWDFRKRTEKIEERLNALGRDRTPTLFILSYDLSESYIFPLDRLEEGIRYHIDGPLRSERAVSLPYRFEAVPLDRYRRAFDRVMEEIRRGNTYLLNLTFPSRIEIDADLETLYERSDARFKLLFKNRFVCFSPERFVRIDQGHIHTHPMKGTIDASIPGAEEKILSDAKEMAEHVMVVDLLRNDLSMVADRVRVERFRYVEKIRAGERELLQVSSHITGKLEEGWPDRLGTILTRMLPAGSITGAPKRKTTEIIQEVEGYDRGFFTGIFGVFDGESLDSAVMIRFIERQRNGLVFKSGGGITVDSDPEAEYRELQEKIYVPFL
ncbi:aminodeoxychorismate synthase component I [Nitratifractor sp.]|uniref:aminodeoxychorismate synthase component I n=1 Tax=Nitratifractor sp. TaxID=2268144 RepID=UPI0025F6FD17|nr:aminodeoxychorismate synthase component I [Nitratifractor sp.]